MHILMTRDSSVAAKSVDEESLLALLVTMFYLEMPQQQQRREKLRAISSNDNTFDLEFWISCSSSTNSDFVTSDFTGSPKSTIKVFIMPTSV